MSAWIYPLSKTITGPYMYGAKENDASPLPEFVDPTPPIRKKRISSTAMSGVDKFASYAMAKKRAALHLLNLEKTAGLTTDVIIPKLYEKFNETVESATAPIDESKIPKAIIKSRQRFVDTAEEEKEEVAATPVPNIAGIPISTITDLYAGRIRDVGPSFD